MSPFMPKYLVQTIPTATPAAVGSGPVRIMKVIFVGGSGNSTFELKNAATDAGTVLLSGAALIGTSMPPYDLEDVGGQAFSVGCFAKPAGAGALLYVWYEPMQTQVPFA